MKYNRFKNNDLLNIMREKKKWKCFASHKTLSQLMAEARKTGNAEKHKLSSIREVYYETLTWV